MDKSSVCILTRERRERLGDGLLQGLPRVCRLPPSAVDRHRGHSFLEGPRAQPSDRTTALDRLGRWRPLAPQYMGGEVGHRLRAARCIDTDALVRGERWTRFWERAPWTVPSPVPSFRMVCKRKVRQAPPLELVLAVYVTPTHTSDRAGARRLLADRKLLVPRLELIWADSAYSGDAWRLGVTPRASGALEIIKQQPQAQGFVVQLWCEMVERTLAWMGRQRRLSKDYERKIQTNEILLKLTMIRLMGARATKKTGRFCQHALRDVERR